MSKSVEALLHEFTHSRVDGREPNGGLTMEEKYDSRRVA